MNSSSLKIAVSLAAVVGMSALACSSGPAAEGVDTTVDTNRLAPKACPRGQICEPVPCPKGQICEPVTCPKGEVCEPAPCPKGAVCDPPPEPPPCPRDRICDLPKLDLELQPATQAPGGIQCTGPSGETDKSYWTTSRTLPLECLSVELIEIDGGIPNGYSILSSYICPVSYPVLRCNSLSYCTCWTW